MAAGKYVISIIIACMLVLFVPSVFAEESGSWKNIEWFLDDKGVLSISGTGNMPDAPSENVPWNKLSYFIKQVVVEEGVTSIGECAFKGCTRIENIELPSTVKSIGDFAFYGCWALTELDIPNGVESLGRCAVYDCESLTKLSIPASLTYFGPQNGEYCNALKEFFVNSQNSRYSSEKGVLFDKAKTTLIRFPSGKEGAYIIPDGVVTITEGAFEFSYDLTELVIPESVDFIGQGAFNSCTGLTRVEMPKTMSTLAPYAFANCEKLNGIEIPSGIKSINAQAFIGCANLAHVILPEGITEISHGAFGNCSSLEEITFPESLITIADIAFDGCKFTTITIPKNVIEIGFSAFEDCKSLKQFLVDEENKVFSSEDGVLFDKAKKKIILCAPGKEGSYKIPDGVKLIQAFAFNSCIHLTEITMPDTVEEIGICAFQTCRGLKRINLPDGITYVGKNAFSQCRSLEKIIYPGSVSAVGSYMFSECDALYNVVLEEGIQSIEEYAFSDTICLKEILIPKSVAYIDEDAFAMSSIKTIKVYAGSYAEAYMKQHAEDLWEIHRKNYVVVENDTGTLTLPPETKEVADEAFEGTGFTKVVLPEGIKKIGSGSFAGNPNLMYIYLPNSLALSGIANNAFEDCDLLTILCKEGSDAQKYAEKNNIPYMIVY